MVTGSVVSSMQGEPRSTHDIDIIVALEQSSVDALIVAFPQSEYYMSKDSVLDAIDHHGMFNLLNVKTGDKVDFWLLEDTPFDRSRFSRRYVEEVLGMRIMVSSPEDTILGKLNWARMSGGSEKQFTDALRVYEVQFETLDFDYLHSWAKTLGVDEMFTRLRNEAA